MIPFYILAFFKVDYKLLRIFAFLITLIVIIFGFFAGLLLSFLYEPVSYWRSYNMPIFWVEQYLAYMERDTTRMLGIFLLPPLLLIDFFRIYIHFSLTHGSIGLWISEFITLNFLVKSQVLLVLFNPGQGRSPT